MNRNHAHEGSRPVINRADTKFWTHSATAGPAAANKRAAVMSKPALSSLLRQGSAERNSKHRQTSTEAFALGDEASPLPMGDDTQVKAASPEIVAAVGRSVRRLSKEVLDLPKSVMDKPKSEALDELMDSTKTG